MYPTNDVQIVGQTAAAGDAITASVVRSGTSDKLTLTDATHTADSFTKTETCSASSCVDSRILGQLGEGLLTTPRSQGVPV